MKIDLRRLIRRAVRQAGFQRTIAPTFMDVMRHQRVDVVLDVGAIDGDYAREIRDAGYAGRIVSFEPASSTYARLRAAAGGDPHWEPVQLGVGEANGHLDLSVSALDVYSSFKRPSDFGSEAPGTREVESERVPVVRLDDYLRDRPELLSRTYLKIDTQGFEAEVLRGAGDVLDRFVAIQAELGLLSLYENQMDWLDVVNWMRSRGFEVATMVCNAGDRANGQAIEYDIVFTRRDA